MASLLLHITKLRLLFLGLKPISKNHMLSGFYTMGFVVISIIIISGCINSTLRLFVLCSSITTVLLFISGHRKFQGSIIPLNFSIHRNQIEPNNPANENLPKMAIKEGLVPVEDTKDVESGGFGHDKRETQIKESEERFRSLVESAPYGIVLADEEGIIRLINRQTEVLFGYERYELIGKPIETLLPVRFRPNHLGYRNSFYHHPQTRPMGVGRDLYALHKDNYEIPVEIGLTPLKTHDKLMVLGTIVDITERKKNEEKLMQKNEELARFNEELKARTSQLIQSEKMSALGTLIAGVAHELNNPITGILNYAQYCKKNVPPDGKLAEVLDDLVFEAKRSAEIVKNLLTYSYFTSGEGVKSIHETADIKDVVKRACGLFTHLLNDIHLTLDIENNLPGFRIQANKLQQVVSNIIKNSIDAMENCPEKVITIKAYCDSEKCHLIIEDTGKGISSGNLSKIFDPFYTTKDVGKGTGLGLSVSKSIIEEYNGEISLESEINKGTRFHIKLPVSLTM